VAAEELHLERWREREQAIQ